MLGCSARTFSVSSPLFQRFTRLLKRRLAPAVVQCDSGESPGIWRILHCNTTPWHRRESPGKTVLAMPLIGENQVSKATDLQKFLLLKFCLSETCGRTFMRPIICCDEIGCVRSLYMILEHVRRKGMKSFCRRKCSEMSRSQDREIQGKSSRNNGMASGLLHLCYFHSVNRDNLLEYRAMPRANQKDRHRKTVIPHLSLFHVDCLTRTTAPRYEGPMIIERRILRIERVEWRRKRRSAYSDCICILLSQTFFLSNGPRTHRHPFSFVLSLARDLRLSHGDVRPSSRAWVEKRGKTFAVAGRVRDFVQQKPRFSGNQFWVSGRLLIRQICSLMSNGVVDRGRNCRPLQG
jgi:hypothetical protein